MQARKPFEEAEEVYRFTRSFPDSEIYSTDEEDDGAPPPPVLPPPIGFQEVRSPPFLPWKTMPERTAKTDYGTETHVKMQGSSPYKALVKGNSLVVSTSFRRTSSILTNQLSSSLSFASPNKPKSRQKLTIHQRRALMLIVNWWRAILLGRQVREELKETQVAAIPIQAVWRMYHVRLRLRNIQWAALTIQRIFRGWLGKQESIKMLTVAELAMQQQLFNNLSEDENAWTKETLYELVDHCQNVQKATTMTEEAATTFIHAPLAVDVNGDLRNMYPYGWGQVLGSLIRQLNSGLSKVPVKTIQCGAHFTAVLSASGEVWTFGIGGRGQLGRPTANNTNASRQFQGENWTQQPAKITQFSPVQSDVRIPQIETNRQKVYISKLAVGDEHCVAIGEHGELFSWGANSLGQLGHNLNPLNKHKAEGIRASSHLGTPRQVRLSARCLDVQCGAAHTLALLTGGNIYTWGAGDPLVAKAGGAFWNPRRVQIAGTARKIACGAYFSMTIRDDTSVIGWGYNESGQLGIGRRSKLEDSPCKVINFNGGNFHATDIVCGKSHCIAVGTSGQRIYSWGANSSGQLGLGDYKPRTDPCEVKTLTNAGVKFITAATRHSMAASTAAVWLWGYSESSCSMPLEGSPAGNRRNHTPTLFPMDFLPVKIKILGLESTGFSNLTSSNIRFSVQAFHQKTQRHKTDPSEDTSLPFCPNEEYEMSSNLSSTSAAKSFKRDSKSPRSEDSAPREPIWCNNFSRAHLEATDSTPLRSEVVASPIINPHRTLSLDPGVARELLSQNRAQATNPDTVSPKAGSDLIFSCLQGSPKQSSRDNATVASAPSTVKQDRIRTQSSRELIKERRTINLAKNMLKNDESINEKPLQCFKKSQKNRLSSFAPHFQSGISRWIKPKNEN